MSKTGIGLLVAAALCAVPAGAFAQTKPAAKAGGAAATGDKGDAKAGDAKAGDAKAGDAKAGDAAAGADAAAADGTEPAADGTEPVDTPEEPPEGGLDDICKIDPAACPNLDMDKEAAKPLKEQIYAVQQIFALRVRRVELNPYWSFSLNDQFVSHPAPGLAVNYYITNVLAIGANFNYYRPFNVDSEFNAQHRRAARVGVPLTEYDWGAALNFTYVPAYGKFAGFQDFIFHYDAYVVGGVGALSARPIAVIDPDFRNFEFEPKIAFNAGIGLRIFFNRWFAATAEVRDYVFNDKLESLNIPRDQAARADKSNWTDESRLTNNVQAQIGVSIMIPFSFDYRLPK